VHSKNVGVRACLRVCVRVCMCVCMYVCMNICVLACIYVRTYVCSMLYNLRPSLERSSNIWCYDHHNACICVCSLLPHFDIGTIWPIFTKLLVNVMLLDLQDTATLYVSFLVSNQNMADARICEANSRLAPLTLRHVKAATLWKVECFTTQRKRWRPCEHFL
jgi:hypothetical protein